MKFELSSRVFLAILFLFLAFLLLRSFQFTQSMTSFLRDNFWEPIF